MSTKHMFCSPVTEEAEKIHNTHHWTRTLHFHKQSRISILTQVWSGCVDDFRLLSALFSCFLVQGSVMEWSIKKTTKKKNPNTVQSFPLFPQANSSISEFWGCTRCSENGTKIYARVRITGNCSLVNAFCIYNLPYRVILFTPVCRTHLRVYLFISLFITCNFTHTQLKVDLKRALLYASCKR